MTSEEPLKENSVFARNVFLFCFCFFKSIILTTEHLIFNSHGVTVVVNLKYVLEHLNSNVPILVKSSVFYHVIYFI